MASSGSAALVCAICGLTPGEVEWAARIERRSRDGSLKESIPTGTACQDCRMVAQAAWQQEPKNWEEAVHWCLASAANKSAFMEWRAVWKGRATAPFLQQCVESRQFCGTRWEEPFVAIPVDSLVAEHGVDAQAVPGVCVEEARDHRGTMRKVVLVRDPNDRPRVIRYFTEEVAMTEQPLAKGAHVRREAGGEAFQRSLRQSTSRYGNAGEGSGAPTVEEVGRLFAEAGAKAKERAACVRAAAPPTSEPRSAEAPEDVVETLVSAVPELAGPQAQAPGESGKKKRVRAESRGTARGPKEHLDRADRPQSARKAARKADGEQAADGGTELTVAAVAEGLFEKHKASVQLGYEQQRVRALAAADPAAAAQREERLRAMRAAVKIRAEAHCLPHEDFQGLVGRVAAGLAEEGAEVGPAFASVLIQRRCMEELQELSAEGLFDTIWPLAKDGEQGDNAPAFDPLWPRMRAAPGDHGNGEFACTLLIRHVLHTLVRKKGPKQAGVAKFLVELRELLQESASQVFALEPRSLARRGSDAASPMRSVACVRAAPPCSPGASRKAELPTAFRLMLDTLAALTAVTQPNRTSRAQALALQESANQPSKADHPHTAVARQLLQTGAWQDACTQAWAWVVTEGIAADTLNSCLDALELLPHGPPESMDDTFKTLESRLPTWLRSMRPGALTDVATALLAHLEVEADMALSQGEGGPIDEGRLCTTNRRLQGDLLQFLEQSTDGDGACVRAASGDGACVRAASRERLEELRARIGRALAQVHSSKSLAEAQEALEALPEPDGSLAAEENFHSVAVKLEACRGLQPSGEQSATFLTKARVLEEKSSGSEDAVRVLAALVVLLPKEAAGTLRSKCENAAAARALVAVADELPAGTPTEDSVASQESEQLRDRARAALARWEGLEVGSKAWLLPQQSFSRVTAATDQVKGWLRACGEARVAAQAKALAEATRALREFCGGVGDGTSWKDGVGDASCERVLEVAVGKLFPNKGASHNETITALHGKVYHALLSYRRVLSEEGVLEDIQAAQPAEAALREAVATNVETKVVTAITSNEKPQAKREKLRRIVASMTAQNIDSTQVQAALWAKVLQLTA